MRPTIDGADEAAALAASASQGDADAFCALIRRSHTALYRLAWRFCGNHHDAEDLVQEVSLNAYRAIGSFRGASSFETWLRRIMVNAFLNFRRRADRRTESFAPPTADAAPAAGAAAPSAYRQVLARQILDRLDEIPPRQRLMFLMRYQEGLTSQEIAEHFGTTAGTVKKTVFRVVDRLRREFDGAAVATPAEEIALKKLIKEEGNARLPEIP